MPGRFYTGTTLNFGSGYREIHSPTPNTDVDGMAKAITEPMLSTVANIAPRVERCQEPKGWCCSEDTKAEMLAAPQERKAAR